MLDALKRLMSRHPPVLEWPEVAHWAKTRKVLFKRVRDEGGFVVDGELNGKPWRLEWGAPQRQYIAGNELRLRMELNLKPDLQMLVLSQSLYEVLERCTFESFTDTTQTVMDGNTPEEMRWIVMYPPVDFLGTKAVRSRFRVMGGSNLQAVNWVEGELATHLEVASENFLKQQPPFMLMVLRGRLYLRMRLNEPHVAPVAEAVTLFETAVLQAMRTAATTLLEEDDPDRHAWPRSEVSTAWQTQFGPDEPPEERH